MCSDVKDIYKLMLWYSTGEIKDYRLEVADLILGWMIENNKAVE